MDVKTWRHRLAACTATVLGLALLNAGPAFADDTRDALVGNARFVHTAEVRPFAAAGIGCRAFGFCDDVTPGSIHDGGVIHHGERNEPVIVDCTVGQGSLYRITLDKDGTDTYDGLVNVGAVRVDNGARVEPC